MAASALGLGAAMLAAAASGMTAAAQTPAAPPSLQTSPIPGIAPSQLPRVAPGLPALGGQLSNAAPNTPIAVRSVSVDGATVFAKAELDALVAASVGPAVPLRSIEDARLAVLRKYRDGGYPLVSVQATRSPDGALHYRVFEGRIVEIQLEGDLGPAGEMVQRFLNRLTEYRPIDAASLERWILLAQDVPGISLKTVLRPSAGDPGALVLVAKAERAAISGLLTADNRAYKLSGPEQILGVVDFNSFTGAGERTEISLYNTFGKRQLFGQVSSEFFLGSSGLRVKLYAGSGRNTPSGFLGTLGYDGITTVVGAQASYPLIR